MKRVLTFAALVATLIGALTAAEAAASPDAETALTYSACRGIKPVGASRTHDSHRIDPGVARACASAESARRRVARRSIRLPGGLNTSELAWCYGLGTKIWQVKRRIRRYRACIKAYKLRGHANRVTSRLFPKPGGRNNAFRHCFISGLLTAHLGPRAARGFTSRHESYRGNKGKDRGVDQWNNAWGRHFGRFTSSGRRLARSCVQGTRRGGVLNTRTYKDDKGQSY